MITILIVGNNISDNERIAGSIIGGTELTTCVICTRSAAEAQQMAESGVHKIDLFIISIKMKEQSGHRLAEKIRKIPEYRDCPILFVTNLSYNASGFSELATYQSYRKYNYISLPVERIDVQGKLGLYLETIISSQSARSQAERAVSLSHIKGEAVIGVKDIFFAEVRNKICSIYTADEIFEISRKNLNDIIKIVDDSYFLRCHRGFALNIRHLKGIEKTDRRLWRAVFGNGSGTCLISKSYIDPVMEKYKTFQSIQSK
jgi:DNA-binding LytR/AlgR family response regulator